MPFDLGATQDAAAKSWGLDPTFFRALGQVESGNNVGTSDSSAGAMGPMQVMPATGAGLGVTDPRDPVQNVFAGAKYLSQMLDRYKDPNLAAAAYNAGPGRVDDYLAGRAPLPAETQAYVPKVAAAYHTLSGSAAPSPSPSPAQPAPPDASTMPSSTPAAASPSSAAPDPFDTLMQAAQGTGGSASAPAPAAAPPSASQTPQTPAGSGDPFGDLMAAATAKGEAAPAGAASSTSTPTAAQAPTTPEASWHQGTVLGDLVSGVSSGFQRTVGGLAHLAAAADDAVPVLRTIDGAVGLDPTQASNILHGNADAADAAHPNSTSYNVGNFVGSTAAVAPLVETGAGALGLAGGAAARLLGGTGGQVIRAGTNLLTGGGATLPARIVTAATSGAAKAAMAGTVSDGGTQNLGSNALLGGALGPAALAVAPVLSPIARAGQRLLGGLAGDADTAAASLGGSTPATPGAAPAGAPAGSGPGAGAPAAAPPAPQPAVAPPQLPLGIIPSVKNADQLAQDAIDHYMQGGPTAAVQSQIPGVQLTTAQATGNPNLAALERTMRDQNPTPFVALDQQNAAARTAYAQNIIGTPDMVDAAEAARDTVTAQARTAAFANAQPVNASPVVAQLQDMIDGATGRPTVQAPLRAVLDQVAPADPTTGVRTPLTNPEQLYNVRKYLGDMVAPRAAGTASDGQAAAAQLMSLKPTLDATIEQGAPGFQSYIGQFDQLSRPIDAMRFLQSKKLLNADGVVQRGALDHMLHTIQVQQSAPGYRLADSVTPEQLQGLTALRDDLNMANRSSLGKSLGSNTAQNLFTASKANSLLSGASGGAADYVAGGIGAGLGAATAGLAGTPLGFAAGGAAAMARGAYASRLAASRSAAVNALVGKLLDPQAALGGRP